MIGRESELQQIASAFGDPGCRGAVISASAGVGKSRLAREACAAAAADGALTLWAQATASSATIPLGALAGLIPDEVRSHDPLELIRRSAEALRERAGSRRVVLAVDDVQLLDEASAGLVLHLATTANVFVLATARLGLSPPDAIEALWKDAGARLMELERLSDEAIVRLVEAGLGGPVEQATAQRVVDISAGNPLYARELVLGALDAGVLALERGLWRLRGRPSVSPSLTAVITRRLGILGGVERAPLELLAIGEPLRLGEVLALTSYAGLEAAEERGMVVVGAPGTDGEVRLAHPLYGEVLTAELPALRARMLRLRLAEAIQRRRPLSPDDALRATRWLIDAGEPIPSALLTDAAAAANLAGDPELGAQLAQLAIDAGGGLSATLLLARAHIIRNRFEAAETVLADAEPHVPGDPLAIEYVNQRVHVLQWGLRHTQESQALLERAQGWSSDPAWSKRLEASRLAQSALMDGFAPRLQTIADLLSDPELEFDRRRRLEGMHVLALMSVGRGKEAHAVCRRIRPAVPVRDATETYALGTMCVVGLETGEDWADLEQYMARTLREGIRTGDHEAAGIAAFTLGSLEMERGRYRDAERWFVEAEGELEHHDTFDTIFCLRALQVGIAYFTGDPARARLALESARAQLSKREPQFGQLPYVACAEGWGARALSESAGAERFIHEASLAQDPSLRSRLLYEALRAGARPAAVATELTELAGRCDSRLVAARAAYAQARAAGDGRALEAAGERFAALGAQVSAMEAAVDAARQFIAEGRMDSARRAAAAARERHAPDHGAEFPLIDGLGGVAVDLSPREAQIAALAARGLSNQEIADQIVLSVRTVETYVYRAMQKRGVSNRRQL